jgi:hypothetical protein
MSIQKTLQKEVKESKRWLVLEKDDSAYKRDLQKKIELINWGLENMKNPDIRICHTIESRISDIIMAINKTYSLFEADRLHSELKILNWIFYPVCSSKDKII